MNTSTAQFGLFNPRVLLAFTLCSVAVILAALGFAAPPTPPGWAIVTSPNANVAQMFNGVACASASDCWAVGNRYNSEVLRDVTLIEHWNGTSWTIVTSPNATTPDNFIEDNFLNGVACASASECWAVGDHSYPGEQPLIERWDGTSWTVVTLPNIGTNAFLKSVTCTSTTD